MQGINMEGRKEMKRKKLIFLFLLSMVGMSLFVEKNVLAEENANGISMDVELIMEENNGFVHPGISVDPLKLENTRKELIDGKEPWKSFYEAMKETKYASLSFQSANLKAGTMDEPKDPTFKKSSMNVNLSNDGFRAYTQAVLYYLTGDSQYRYNALRLVRIWENMDPDEFEYYADSHIHVGTPFYYMISAAELLRYTTVIDKEYNDEHNKISNYNLNWTEEDTTKLTKNLIDPVISTFLYTNDRYLNQHIYPVIGAMAGYIFKEDKERFHEAVEWAMVNSTTDKPEINGALQNQFHLIESDHPQNPTGTSYIQHLEMGRDQAHGSGDVLNFTGIARILTQQKIKVDPINGTVSEQKNAETPYAFLNRRLLSGAENLYSYMGGYTIPWTELGYQDYGGKVSEAYRGRTGLYFNMSELYDAYRYLEGMTKEELEQQAPQISYMAKNLTSPVFYNGTAKTNFWGSFSDNKMTEIGSEYWLSIPSERNLDPELEIPSQINNSSAVFFEERAAILDENLAMIKSEEETTYIRVRSAKSKNDIIETQYNTQYPNDKKTIRGGSQLALPSLIKSRQDGSEYISLRIRSTGNAKLLISGNNYYSESFQSVSIPDTNGKWKNIVYTVNAKEQISRTARQLENLDYYAVIADNNVTVDFDQLQYINMEGGLQTDVPSFKEEKNPTYYLLKDIPFEKQISVENNTNVTLSLVNAPNGMTIDQNGTLKWVPNKKTKDPIEVTVIADNGKVINTITIKMNVANNKKQAYKEVLATLNQDQTYTTKSYQRFLINKNEVEKLLKGKADDTKFLETLRMLVESINELELLNPKLEDGTFNYFAYDSIISSVTTMNKDNLKNLMDNDTATHSGDVKQPIVFDFGSDYQMKVNAFSFQARRGFPNRSEGTNVYGSNDGVNWILLTETHTSNTEEMERVQVKESLTEEGFRYLKFQVDYPGVPTDPAYPGIISYAEIRIEGTRQEINN
jgi:hypothetical protein